MPKDALTRRRGRRAAGFCQEQTLVMTEQFSCMEGDVFHVPYLSDKIPEAVFHGQAVKTVADLRVSTAQQDVRSQHLAILVEKTRCCLVPEESMTFLGYRIGCNYWLDTGAAYIGTRPSHESVQSICRRVSELTTPRHVLLPPGVVVGRLNRLLTGVGRTTSSWDRSARPTRRLTRSRGNVPSGSVTQCWL